MAGFGYFRHAELARLFAVFTAEILRISAEFHFVRVTGAGVKLILIVLGRSESVLATKMAKIRVIFLVPVDMSDTFDISFCFTPDTVRV